jgi:hypothetical protein
METIQNMKGCVRMIEKLNQIAQNYRCKVIDITGNEIFCNDLNNEVSFTVRIKDMSNIEKEFEKEVSK